MKILVLAAGSPFGADNAAWDIIEKLRATLPTGLRIKLGTADRPGPHLLEIIKPYSHVILIDSAISSAPIGSLELINHEEYLNQDTFSTHEIGVLETLKLGMALNKLPKKLEIYAFSVVPDKKPEAKDIQNAAKKIHDHLTRTIQ